MGAVRPRRTESRSKDADLAVLRKAVKLAVASASDDLIPGFLEEFSAIHPELELYVLSEFRPTLGRWIPYHQTRTVAENLEYCRFVLRDCDLQLAALVLQPNMPYWRMRAIPLRMAPMRTLFFNEHMNHFMLRPQSLPTMLRHFGWRLDNFLRWQVRPGGPLYTFGWRLGH